MSSHPLETETLAILSGLLSDSAAQVAHVAAKDLTTLQANDRHDLAHVLHALEEAIGRVRHVFLLPQHVDVVAPTDMSEQTPFPQ